VFRLLWIGWSISYAGDALQLIAQTWLIALLTNSALAVAGSPALASLPLVLLPLGGVVADAYDRRRLLLVVQLAGALAAGGVALLVATHRIAVWHIYVWVVFASLLRVVGRPAYKVLLTAVVPAREARSAMALSSMTETGSMVLVTGLGALLLSAVGLTAAFVANALTYVVAAWALWHHRRIPEAGRVTARLSARSALGDLRAGFGYLRGNRAILHPLVLTFLFVLAASPLFTLLAAVVHAQGRSLVDLGVLGAAALALFAVVPIGWASLGPLIVVGTIFGAETVWNASRVAELGDPVFQGRLQAVTTMVLGVGSALGALWAGPVLDAFGLRGLLCGAVGLAVASVGAAFAISAARARARDGVRSPPGERPAAP